VSGGGARVEMEGGSDGIISFLKRSKFARADINLLERGSS
jgi:hypothetical protein